MKLANANFKNDQIPNVSRIHGDAVNPSALSAPPSFVRVRTSNTDSGWHNKYQIRKQ